MLRARIACLALLLLAACSSTRPEAQLPASATHASADAEHGSLLYDTVCAACHTDRAHWRDKSVVHSWSDLVYQVTRWQKNAGQQWGGDDIEDVAAYLNGRFYHLECPIPGCRGTGPQASSAGTGRSSRR